MIKQLIALVKGIGQMVRGASGASTPEFIRVEEAAKRSGVSVPTVRRLLAAGRLKYRARQGRRLLLEASEAQDAIARRRERPIELLPREKELAQRFPSGVTYTLVEGQGTRIQADPTVDRQQFTQVVQRAITDAQNAERR
jgi:excisionase family DNA binding protein